MADRPKQMETRVTVDQAQDLPQGIQFKLFVGGISAHTSTEVLFQHFSKYGQLSDAVVMVKDGRARGFGFVTFVSELAAVRALAEPQWIDGRFVDVKAAVPGERAQEKPSNKIFIGGLPQDVTTDKLREYFSSYGIIADAVVMVDRQTLRSRGFGFIRFANGRHGAAAAQAVLRDFQHHWLEVDCLVPFALMAWRFCYKPAVPIAGHRLRQRRMARPWHRSCKRSALGLISSQDMPEVAAVLSDTTREAHEVPEPSDPSFGMEVRICPVSGLSTLQGACPFAKPKAKAKDGGKKQKASIKLDFKWKQDESIVSISVCAHHTDAFAALELPDSASQEEIKRQYKALSLKHHPDKNQDDVDAATERFQRTDVLHRRYMI
eukprot:symbB.v1.2.015928.t1/scaffold1202.1/size131747/12